MTTAKNDGPHQPGDRSPAHGRPAAPAGEPGTRTARLAPDPARPVTAQANGHGDRAVTGRATSPALRPVPVTRPAMTGGSISDMNEPRPLRARRRAPEARAAGNRAGP